MFGNAYIDFCLTNYADLTALAIANSPAIKYLRSEAKMFAMIYQFILSKQGKLIPLTEFTALGVDYQTLALTVFLVAFKQGFKVISMSPEGVIYY